MSQVKVPAVPRPYPPRVPGACYRRHAGAPPCGRSASGGPRHVASSPCGYRQAGPSKTRREPKFPGIPSAAGVVTAALQPLPARSSPTAHAPPRCQPPGPPRHRKIDPFVLGNLGAGRHQQAHLTASATAQPPPPRIICRRGEQSASRPLGHQLPSILRKQNPGCPAAATVVTLKLPFALKPGPAPVLSRRHCQSNASR